ncbi:hypothetical protein MJO29_000677 [Puccinia striiformis f. sp. tritici]|uniref:hypothetical protein n=1 Tax=Puccinia striiformis f. sp. tritici TaxID=168172 RepID=UPI0020076982|nr:hypothetical protein Pst134EA_000689 [Puccinia striiformis f. sp. tritici]KAH9473606.1 hypothetical protein Pst134EA_000689 [Puccinia striiformis f. sp. tritici]KAI7967400.1 hypothetical protein MJO29_000677 [Puccinia striiformis f. sp. tritici]
MPTVKITNKTSRPINVALSIIVPIHFQNELLPTQTWETQVGSVWFKFECREDDGSNRYSISQSAMTLGLFSLTGASIALVTFPLAITGLAPIAGSSCAFLTALAGKPLIVAAATPEVLTLTTWIATNLTRKTVYQIASEQGLKEEELEKTLQETSTLLEGIKYLCLPTATNSPGEKTEEPGRAGTPEFTPADTNIKNPLLGILDPELLNRFIKFYSSKTDGKIAHVEIQPEPQKPSPFEVSPSNRQINDPNTTKRKKPVKESPLDSLTSVFHEFSKFQRQTMIKRKKRKLAKKDSSADLDPLHVDLDPNSIRASKTITNLDHQKAEEEDWELVEREIDSKGEDQLTLNVNETIFIGFNALYQFEWHINQDIGKNGGTKFKLVDKSS